MERPEEIIWYARKGDRAEILSALPSSYSKPFKKIVLDIASKLRDCFYVWHDADPFPDFKIKFFGEETEHSRNLGINLLTSDRRMGVRLEAFLDLSHSYMYYERRIPLEWTYKLGSLMNVLGTANAPHLGCPQIISDGVVRTSTIGTSRAGVKGDAFCLPSKQFHLNDYAVVGDIFNCVDNFITCLLKPREQ